VEFAAAAALGRGGSQNSINGMLLQTLAFTTVTPALWHSLTLALARYPGMGWDGMGWDMYVITV